MSAGSFKMESYFNLDVVGGSYSSGSTVVYAGDLGDEAAVGGFF